MLVSTSVQTVAQKFTPGRGTIATPEVGEDVVTLEITVDKATVPGVVVTTQLITGTGGPVMTPGGGAKSAARTLVVPPLTRAPATTTSNQLPTIRV